MKSVANTAIDQSIYFGGRENLTNSFKRILYGSQHKIRGNVLPINILISASTLVKVDDLIPILDILKMANSRICLVSIDPDEKSQILQILTKYYPFSVIKIDHWDHLYRNVPKVLKYLLNVV